MYYRYEYPMFITTSDIKENPPSPFQTHFEILNQISESEIPKKIQEIFPNAKVWYDRSRVRISNDNCFNYTSMLINYNENEFFMCESEYGKYGELTINLVEGIVKDNIVHVYRYCCSFLPGGPFTYLIDLMARDYLLKKPCKLKSTIFSGVKFFEPPRCTFNVMSTVVAGLLALNVLQESTHYKIAQVRPWKYWKDFNAISKYKYWLFGTREYLNGYTGNEVIASRNEPDATFTIAKYFFRRKWAMGVFRRFRRNNAATIIQKWWLDQFYNPKRKYCQQRLEKEFNELIQS